MKRPTIESSSISSSERAAVPAGDAPVPAPHGAVGRRSDMIAHRLRRPEPPGAPDSAALAVNRRIRRGNLQTAQTGVAQRTLPAHEFFEAELVEAAGIVELQPPGADGSDHLGLLARKPAGRGGRRNTLDAVEICGIGAQRNVVW